KENDGINPHLTSDEKMGSASVARGAESQVSGMRLGNLLFQFGEIAVVMDNIVSSAYPLSTTDLGSHDCFNLFPRVAVPTAGPCDLQRFACINDQYAIDQFVLAGFQQQR